MLTELSNDNCDWSELTREAEHARTTHNVVEVNLICLSKLIKYCIRKGNYKTAEEKLNEYAATLPTCKPSEMEVFQVIEQYLRCLMERSNGNYDKSYEIAKECLDTVDKIQPGIVSTEFYVLAATVVNILAMKTEDASARRPLLAEANDLIYKAARHVQDVRTSELVKADLKQKVYTNQVMFLSGSCLAGYKLTDFHASVVDKNEATKYLDWTNHIVTDQNIPLSDYRNTQLYLAKSDLFYLASMLEEGRKSYLLKQASKFAQQAKRLAEVDKFPELESYAQNRIAIIEQETGNACNILHFAPLE